METAPASVAPDVAAEISGEPMTDTDTTEADTADTAAEQHERLPILPEAWRQVFALIELCSDPRGFKKKLQGLHRALTAVDEGMARLAADRAEHDRIIAAERAELAERERQVRFREIEVDGANAQRAREANPEDDGWTAPAGSGMGRSSPRRIVRHDDLGQSYGAHTTLTRTTDAE